MDAVEIIYWVAAALLLGAALFTLLRLAWGPTTLDRALAADLLTSVAIALTVLVIVWWNRADLQVLLVVFALTGLFSSTTIAKFIGKESKVRGEPLPSAQVEQFEAKLAEEEAWLERRLHLGRHGTVETTGPERSGDYAETTEEEQ